MKIGEAFKAQWRRKRPDDRTMRRYLDALSDYEEAKRQLADQTMYDFAKRYFIYGYMAGYDHAGKEKVKK